ncbi:MAG: winged helix-turn-helix transcriptional regulator [Candidatus Hodarchaeota archaeon]
MLIRKTILFSIIILTSFTVPYELSQSISFPHNENRAQNTFTIVSNEDDSSQPGRKQFWPLQQQKSTPSFDELPSAAIPRLKNLNVANIATSYDRSFEILHLPSIGKNTRLLLPLDTFSSVTRADFDIIDSFSAYSTFWVSLFPLLMLSIGKLLRGKEKHKENDSIRSMVYQAIELNPGIHFRELCRELNRKNGVVQYHLYVLEAKENRIHSFQDGEKYTRYFPANGVALECSNEYYFAVLSMLQRPSMAKIIRLLWNSSEGLSRNQLANEIGISTQAITCNCKKLAACGVIEDFFIERQKFYKLTEPTIEVLEILENSLLGF